MRKIEVCLSPELIHQFELEGKLVVVADIFRATSCMVAGIGSGVQSIYPTEKVEECFELGRQGMITAGERGGQKVDGFEIGNSPFEYMQDKYKGARIAVTTTNGTQAIHRSIGAEEILIGAFINLTALINYLKTKESDIIVHCAGWKGTVNIEDTLFAGAVIERMKGSAAADGDPAIMAKELYLTHKNDLVSFGKASSHAKRLERFGITKDLEYCMTQDLFDVVPVFRDGEIQAT